MVYENRSQHVGAARYAPPPIPATGCSVSSACAPSELARHLSERVAEASPAQRSRSDQRPKSSTFKRDDTLLGVVLRDTAGDELYAWRRPGDDSGGITRSAITPVRANVQTMPGIVDAANRRRSRDRDPLARRLAGIRQPRATHFDSMERRQMRKALLLAGGLGVIALAVGLTLAWWAGRRVHPPISTLIKSADRIAQGDYSRPLEVGRRDELGELQAALERMRQKLRQTTINKNYLTNVLGSMTDAVFVTSPDGVIRMANQSACKLLAWGEEELVGRGIVSIFDERERGEFDMLRASQDTRETVVKTRQGQTIPVAITGSQITTDDPQYQGTIFVVRNVTERKRAERRIRYLARYDALTKVPNRMQFQHLLQQAIARAHRATRPALRCCTSTWTGSRRSTTPSVTPPATARSRS